MIGSTVQHPTYGQGIVKASREGGFALLVQFDGGRALWVRVDDVEPVIAQPVPLQQPIQTMQPVTKSFKARRMIEAFRLGIVPYDCADEFTVGRDAEIERLVNWLTRGRKATILIEGAYGTGKTHLLNYAAWRALQEGFAVAQVEMDFNETPFHRPKKVYGQVTRTFQYRSPKDQQIKGFREFVVEISNTAAFKEHRYFGYIHNHLTDPAAWEWIEAQQSALRRYGSEIFAPLLYDYTNSANIYCHLVSSLGWFAKELLGLKGLALIFDEAEIINVRYYPYQLARGQNFLQALIRTAEAEDVLLGHPVKSKLEFTNYAADIPFLYQQPSGLKLLFAFTDLSWNYSQRNVVSGNTYKVEQVVKMKELDKADRISLVPLTEEALSEIYKNIHRLYAEAYEMANKRLTTSATKKLLDGNSRITRQFIKGAVERLDLDRFPAADVLGSIADNEQ